MSPKEIYRKIESPGTAAWISAAAAIVVAVIALWSHAAAPTQDTLGDHEKRIRELEQMTAEDLSRINTQLEAINGQLARMRDE